MMKMINKNCKICIHHKLCPTPWKMAEALEGRISITFPDPPEIYGKIEDLIGEYCQDFIDKKNPK